VNIEATLREFLSDELGKDLRTVGPDDSLLESGTIDSVAVMQMVAFLETRFGLKITDDELVPENFDTLGAIAAFVQSRRTASGD
jgi:acyl carrier protein